MKIEKELSSIALDITEPEYRERPELSYSTLATYERSGFNGLAHLFDRKESPSLLLGSVVDTLLTDGKEVFDRLFFVADFPSVGDKELQIVKQLFYICSQGCPSFADIPYGTVLDAANQHDFCQHWRDDTRVRVLRERCTLYYQLMYQAGGKRIVSRDTYSKALDMVRALKTSPATAGYFADDDRSSPVRRYYQLKFRADLGVDTGHLTGYRCMMDLAVVDYGRKVIYPVDLKTSSHKEWDFQESFIQWSYMIQAQLYAAILRDNLDRDPYFRDFRVENYRFIVVNRESLTPLVWKFPYTFHKGSLVDSHGNTYRHPFEIGWELRHYLDEHPRVPNGINVRGDNIITELKPAETS